MDPKTNTFNFTYILTACVYYISYLTVQHFKHSGVSTVKLEMIDGMNNSSRKQDVYQGVVPSSIRAGF